MSSAFRLLLLAVCLGLSSGHTAPARAQTATTRYVCPMHAGDTSAEPGRCRICKMSLVETTRDAGAKASGEKPAGSGGGRDWASMSAAERARELERLAPTYDYTCSMHPEIHQAQEGTCPKCGMPLMSLTPSVRGEYGLGIIPTPRGLRAGRKVRLRFVVSAPETGARVSRYVLNHEKLFHLFIVSRDLSEYQHIHPQLERDGSFTVETVFPRAGLYKLHSDFFPVDGMPQVIHRDLTTAGYRAGKNVAPVSLTPDKTLTKTVDGMSISLDPGSGVVEPVAGVLVPLKYRLTDARTGEPVRDLEPYLRAWGHTLILNADQSHYLHSHPTELLHAGTGGETPRGGPEVEFRAMFPAAGVYRIWTQFQRAGKITTVSFTIRVRPAG